MLKFLISQLPDWARPNHPILQYELAPLKQVESRKTRFLKILILALILGLGGYLYATTIYVSPTQNNITDLAWRTLYFPTLLIQVITSILALSLGISSVGQERHNRTWDNLRATEIGAELTLRTRWIAILYRLRAPIIAILLVRVVLLIGLLYDITAFGGLYPEMLTQNLTPIVADARIGLVVLVFIMTATMLLPITMIASSAGIGLLISVGIKNRTYSATLQAILILIQLLVTIGLLIALSQFLLGQLDLTGSALFTLFMGYSSFGDWGLLFLQLGSVGEIWAIVPYGIFIGIGLVVLMLIQSAVTDGMLWLAVKLSESRE
jgi:hypothetical protein